MATKTSPRRAAARRKRAESVDKLLSRLDAHEVNALHGRASGPFQARNYGSYSNRETGQV